MKNLSLKGIAAIGLLAYSLTTAAEDIDLFVGASPVGTDVPNVLIVVDNTANWNQAFENEINALVSTVSALPDKKFRVGIMFSAETGSPNNNISGGYVRAAMRLMDETNKAAYVNLLNSIDKNADAGNGGKSSLVMAEAYLYLSAGSPYAGNYKVKTDYLANTSGTAASKEVYLLGGNALNSFNGIKYNTPQSSNCQKNFIIYISNGAPQDNDSVIAESAAILVEEANKLSMVGATVTIPVSPTGSQKNLSDEWARFMKRTALSVTTYTIDVDKVTTGQGPGWTALLKSMASVSSGKYFDVSSGDSGKDIADALKSIFSEVQAINSVFASVSLPVSVNTQGTYLNQVFIGMFRPDEKALPRWAGNLKQYKLGYDSTGRLGTLDADNKDAISSGGTGFISECARSFWTPTTLDTYWKFKPQGACLALVNSDMSNTPDGNIVEKGAQGYKLRSTTARTVYTCAPSSCSGLTPFDNSIPPESLGLLATETNERDALVSWAKGIDVVFDENENGSKTDVRPSVHGDVVHSRPVAINYGTDAAPQVVVFYGGNDGMLRAVNGNRDDGGDVGGKVPGMELWSFMPPEFYTRIKRIYDNTTPISFLGMEEPLEVGDPVPAPKPYGFDGVISAYKEGSTAWIYATMRRGGNAVYAFDVSTPANPTLKWKRDSSTLNNLGQTWSAPKVLKALGYASGGLGTEKPMLIMGGGYDACEDKDPHECDSSTTGNRIYVLDADTGAPLKTFLDIDRAVIADVFVVPDTLTGMAAFAYAADLGGNVYRISGVNANTPFGTTAPGDWTLTKIASLGGSGADARKFMFAPDVVWDNGQYVLLLGSGDREKPLMGYTAATTVANQFFMLKDEPTKPAWLSGETLHCGSALICMNSLEKISYEGTSPTIATVMEKKGWALALKPTEQVVTSAITIFGTVTFSTHEPAKLEENACTSTTGTARVYNIAYANAASMNGTGSRFGEIAGGGLPPSPVAGMVTLDGVDGKPGETVPFCIGCDPDSSLKGGEPPPPLMANQPKSRVYWHIQQ